ncbi:hypothetical protein JVT61DRAFT_5331 [Boletus reticuloceps]|uniref:Uncharacterized protein n=1 Tax=Boletus reticuloceps TaxID=495285 RepID=A0A8I2Z158_9AGAM|nr:hypothetical protein JVT61DRAFT_5331 [Boletus reticuloceps]
MLAHPCLVLALSALALAGERERDILGLLGTSNAWLPLDPIRTTRTLKTSTRFAVSQSVKPTLATSQSSVAQWTSTPNLRTDSAEPTAAKTTLASASPVLPASDESHAASHSSKTWQIIGITIIAVLFIATSITCTMFFDHFRRFLKDVLCCTSRPLASEEFIPDCEKQSWDTRTLSPSPSDWNHYKGESLHEAASVHTIRPRELPWNIDTTQDWNTLHRHPSRRNDHPPTT